MLDPERPTPEDALRAPGKVVPLQWWFAGALVLGAIAIFVGDTLGLLERWITIGVPIVVMFAYIAIGRSYLVHGISRTQYADSIYYLGFLFTLVSITAAIIDVGPEGDVSQIVNRFGVKLITTLIGLGVRVYLVNFRPSGEDVTENVEESLIEASRRLRDRLDQVTLDLASLASSLTLTLRTASERTSTELSSSLTQAAAQFSEALGVLKGQTLAGLSDVRGAAEKAVSEMGGTLGANVGELRERMERATRDLGGASEGLVRRLEATRLPDELLAAQLGPAVERLVGALRDPTKGLDELGSVVATSTRELASAGQHAGALAEHSTRLEAEMSRLVTRMAEVPSLDPLQKATESVGQSLEQLAATARESTERLREANARSEELALLLARRVEEEGRRTGQLAAAQTELSRGLDELRRALETTPRRRGGGWLRRILGSRA